MNVRELKQKIADLPDDMLVMISTGEPYRVGRAEIEFYSEDEDGVEFFYPGGAQYEQPEYTKGLVLTP